MDTPPKRSAATGEDDPNAPAPHPSEAGGRVRRPSARAGDRQIAHHIASRSKRRQIRRLKVVISILLVSLFVFAVGWILAWATLNEARRELAQTEIDLRKTERVLETTQSLLAEREQAIVDLIENRMPGLRSFENNKLVEVGDKYFLSVTFSETGVAESKTFEYHAVLVNGGQEMVLPRVAINFFDDRGLQVGAVELQQSHATTSLGPAELEPGETRSYHSRIDMVREANPKYFKIHVE